MPEKIVWKNDEKSMESQALNPLVDHHLSPEIVYRLEHPFKVRIWDLIQGMDMSSNRDGERTINNWGFYTR